mmetsp:Transcript_47908/g.101820  ORF Transcript_47908/g.101820 Transcript_47908/m.101820 type:complete len:299 (-) Transcript_47908:1446-2342(-)
MSHELFLPARLHHHGDPTDEVGGLHAHRGRLVVEAPLDGPRDLLEVGLAPLPQCVDHSAKPVEHDLPLLPESAGGCPGVDGLLLEGVQDAVDEALLKSVVDIAASQVLQNLLGGLHDHAAVRFRVVLQIVDDPAEYVGASHLVGQFLGSLDDLLVVPPIQRHPPYPKVSKEFWEDLLADVVGLHPGRADALLDHLQHDALHLLVGAVKLARQNGHDQPRVVTGVVLLHERYNEPDRLEERRQPLSVVLQRPLPQRADDRVERLDPVGVRRLSQRRDGEGPHHAHLGLLVRQPVPDYLH